MPPKNSIKTFSEEGFYHAYNRGIEKRKIFLDQEDYGFFLHLMKIYLLPDDSPRKQGLSLVGKVSLLSFCLMPNHFHLLLQQKTKDGMTKLLHKISTTYSMFFNKKYSRTGRLFESIYKAVQIRSEAQLLHVSRYIHLNPVPLRKGRVKDLISYPYSSYPYYLKKKSADWLHSDFILHVFKDFKNMPSLNYQKFVEEDDPVSSYILRDVVLGD